MTIERDLTEPRASGDPVVDLDPEAHPDATDVVEGPVGSASLVDPVQNPDGGADLERLPGVGDIDPEAPLPVHAPGEDVETGPGEDDVPVSKDLLRGGSGEQGEPRHPATDDDLLRNGTGWSETADTGEKP